MTRMGLQTGRRGIWVGAAAGAALLLAAGCASGDGVDVEVDHSDTTTAAAATTTESAPAGEGDDTAATDPGEATMALLALEVDGRALPTDLPQVSCQLESDDGHRQIEFEAEDDARDIEVEVEIVLSDPPRIDDIEIETADAEWEATDADRAAGAVEIDGDRYRVTGPVTSDDDDRVVDAVIEFHCPGL